MKEVKTPKRIDEALSEEGIQSRMQTLEEELKRNTKSPDKKEAVSLFSQDVISLICEEKEDEPNMGPVLPRQLISRQNAEILIKGKIEDVAKNIANELVSSGARDKEFHASAITASLLYAATEMAMQTRQILDPNLRFKKHVSNIGQPSSAAHKFNDI
jgi:hypothetical protein